MTATQLTILVLSHLVAVAIGVALRSITIVGRQAELDAQRELVEFRETFLATHLGGPAPVVPPPPSLVDATLAQAQVRLSEMAARRDRERKEFVDIMTTLTRRVGLTPTVRPAYRARHSTAVPA